jgi:hypothetical protein
MHLHSTTDRHNNPTNLGNPPTHLRRQRTTLHSYPKDPHAKLAAPRYNSMNLRSVQKDLRTNPMDTGNIRALQCINPTTLHSNPKARCKSRAS